MNSGSNSSSFLLKSSSLSSTLCSSTLNSEPNSTEENLQLKNLKYNQKRLSLKTPEEGIIKGNYNQSSLSTLSPTTSYKSCTTNDNIVSSSRVDIFQENSVTKQPILTVTNKETEEFNTTTTTPDALTTGNSCRRSHSDLNSSEILISDKKKPKLEETNDYNKTVQCNVQLKDFDKDKDHHHDNHHQESSSNHVPTNNGKNRFNYVLNPKNRFKSPKILKQIEFMMDQMKKENPDFSLIDKSMDATFRYRKTELDTFRTPITICLKIFPALNHWNIVKSEFDRVQRKHINFQLFEMKIKTVLEENYLKFRKEGFSCNSILPKVNEEDLKNNNKDLLLDVMTFALLFMESNKTSYLDGKLFKIRQVHEQPFFHQFGTPTIDIKGDFLSNVEISVYTEGSKFCQVPTFYDAVLCSYAIHWIFNLEYEKSCAQFFDKLDSLWRK